MELLSTAFLNINTMTSSWFYKYFIKSFRKELLGCLKKTFVLLPDLWKKITNSGKLLTSQIFSKDDSNTPLIKWSANAAAKQTSPWMCMHVLMCACVCICALVFVLACLWVCVRRTFWSNVTKLCWLRTCCADVWASQIHRRLENQMKPCLVQALYHFPNGSIPRISHLTL